MNSTTATDFRALYDEKNEYVLRRDPNSYDAQRIALEVQLFKIPNLANVLPTDTQYRSIVEIGCGTGELVATFPGTDISRRLGFDISPLNIQAARERFPEAAFDDGDFRSCSETFDLVVLSDILEHVPDDVGFLVDASKLGQTVLINLPLERCLRTYFRQYGPDDPSGHLRSYDLNAGLAMIRAAGLVVAGYSQVWSVSSNYELQRLELNQSLRGTRFSGRPIIRLGKQVLHHMARSSKQIRKNFFASNLFVAARHPER